MGAALEPGAVVITPTLGGVFIGLLCLGIELKKWWPGLPALRKKGLAHAARLAPFLKLWISGALFVMTVGGIVGWVGDMALWGTNTFGDGVLIFGVGAESGAAPGSAGQALTQGGLFVTALYVTIFNPMGEDWHGWRGWLSGVGLGLSAGVAKYVAVPLASATNFAGAWLTGVMT